MQVFLATMYSRLLHTVFIFSSFIGALLLFQLEPFIGKSLLPWYGGTPSVWNTCVFFFQFLLLLGYLYVHLLQRFLRLDLQLVTHGIVLLATLFTLPIRFNVTGLSNPTREPLLSLLLDLTVSIGPVFFVVSTTSPLLQVWYVAASLRANPYRLYVASNFGSLAGLLAYPFIIELLYPLSVQSRVLNNLFLGLVFLYIVCGLLAVRGAPSRSVSSNLVIRNTTAAVQVSSSRVSNRIRWNWFWWSFCPSSLMLGVTTYLSAEIAPMPAIWIIPLSLYLLTFIIAFAPHPPWLIPACTIGFAGLAISAAFVEHLFAHSVLCGLVLNSAVLFCGALALHGRLAASRPAVQQLTEFYLWISFGGLCGSFVNSLIAPVTTNWLMEYPLAIGLTIILMPWPAMEQSSRRRLGFALRLILALFVVTGLSWQIYFADSARYVIYRNRSFFGEFHITRGRQGKMHQLVHGGTVHGMQITSMQPRERRPPLTYYFFTGPIGQVIFAYRGTHITSSVGIVGLGIGSIAGYAESGEHYTFYEIDPAIERIAENPRYFTYLKDARARGAEIEVEIGDARLRLREAPDHSFGLLILDAFTSDSVPVHLLTKEAIVEYFQKLHPQGLLAFHVSNQYVNLEPIISEIARRQGYTALVQEDGLLSQQERLVGKTPSKWVIVSQSPEVFEPLAKSGRWQPCRSVPQSVFWTDDHSSLLSLWRRN